MKPVMSPGDVAAVFGVNPKTITRWAREGKLPFFRTAGGHRRYHRVAVEALLRQQSQERSDA